MHVFRKGFLARFIPLFFLAVFGQSLAAPYYTMALTTGPHQPEYTAYESPGSSDMVNLLTGDFSYSMPVFEVPGPEGSFPVPLTYNAGIGLDQESSWCGLGWNINAGSIVRSINEFPDDAQGESQTVSVQDLVGVRGWTSSLLGLGQIGWNTEVGHYGSVGLLDIINYQYSDKGSSSVGLIGVNVGRSGVSFDAVQFTSALMTIMSYGAGAAASEGMSIARSLATQAAVGIAEGAALSAFTPRSAGVPSTSSGHWEYARRIQKKFLHRNYWIYLDDSRQEAMYGTLNLGSAPTVGAGPAISQVVNINDEEKPMSLFNISNNSGAASDINYFMNESGDYRTINNPTGLAYDDYSVNAPGVAGPITPYRLDIGSVSMPRSMTQFHVRMAPLKYLEYKVPFIYKGTSSNSYYYHSGRESGAPEIPSYYTGISSSVVGEMPDQKLLYSLKDHIFGEQRVRNDINGTKRIAQGNHIEYLSNEDIGTHATYPSGFLDFLSAQGQSGISGSPRDLFRTPLGKSLGGFAITSADGKMYHFAIPVMDHHMLTEVKDATDPEHKKSSIRRDLPFANSWLLTAITGPDFIDMNSNGIADDADLGYWVKLNYGKYTTTSDYGWRIPYQGDLRSTDNLTDTHTEGLKQLYYLNSIETRSHVALFFKSSRMDNMGSNGQHTLKLDEINLLTKEHYKKLIKTTQEGGFGLPDFSNQFANLCLSENISVGGRDFANANTVKRVVFSYNYSLCQNTTNSESPEMGKLTLTRVSLLGRKNLKIVPDYKFEYGYNPSYQKDKWDGWGYYNGSLGSSSHKASASDADGFAWSLSKVTTPLGSEIGITYERDTYSSISGEPVMSDPISLGTTIEGGTQPLNYLDVPGHPFVVGDLLKLNGDISYTCTPSSNQQIQSFDAERTIVDVQGSRIFFNQSFVSPNCVNSGPLTIHPSGTIAKIYKSKKGGDIRVSSIVTTDPVGRGNKIRYLYTKPDGSSSGVVAQEPEYIKSIATDFDFYNYPNYPTTPVIYGTVSVLTGNLVTDTDYNTRQEYQFETPNANMLSVEKKTVAPLEQVGTLGYLGAIYREAYQHNISNRLSKIGSLNSIRIKDKQDRLVSETNISYTDHIPNSSQENFQGIYTEGVLMFDIMVEGELGLSQYNKANRTTSISYPYVPQKITSSKDGFTTTTENLQWDFYTADVNRKLAKSSLGLYTKTVTESAYSVKYANGNPVYPELGLKGINIGNKNMVAQNAATYVYRTDPMGNELGLLAANIQLWSNDWKNYRYLTGGNYTDDVSNEHPVWRKSASYTWKGSYDRLRQDGSHDFSSSDKYKFESSATNPLWLYAGEIVRYDRFGMPVEGKDRHDIYSSVKLGYDNRVVIATATNAQYNEIAFSSAEDKIEGVDFFGGEVNIGTASGSTIVSSPVHTGSKALSVSTAGKGFVFKSSTLRIGRSYRASVWANSADGRLYYKVGSGNEVTPSDQTISQAVNIPGSGNWYRIDATISGIGSASIEIGVKPNATAAVVFDDFRFQPLDAVMTCFVQQPLDFEFSQNLDYSPLFIYSLDNNNTFTKTEMNEKGEVVKVYVESLTYGVKLVSETKQNYRRSIVNQ